jgi:hypothetical protein
MISQKYKPVDKRWGWSSTPYQRYVGPTVITLPQTNTSPPATYSAANPGKHSHMYDSYVATRAAAMGITADEWKRREDIVTEAYKQCVFNVGDTFYPYSYSEFEEYGACMVRGKCYTYTQMEKDEWPATDSPLIILAYSRKKNDTFLCNVEFMIKKEPEKVLENA